MDSVVAGNAAYWEQLAPHRVGYSVEEIRALEPLDPIELNAMGGLSGKRCLQVAASVGDEALQMALMGAASVTAVDLAPSHVDRGRRKAQQLGVTVDFRVADMTNLPSDVTGFDIIYISWGGLCWVPELVSWVADMSSRLNAGGRLVIAEHHPLWEILSTTPAGDLRVNGNYFEPRLHPREHDPDKSPQIVKTLNEVDSTTATAFVWNIGSVVTAMLDAGLVLTVLTELPNPDMYPRVTDGQNLPAIYIAAATKKKA